MRSFMILLILLLSFSVFAEESKEKDRLAVMDVQDKDSLFNQKTKGNITDYIFGKLAGTKLYWMIPKSDRDTALEQTIEKTKQDSRKECVDEKCQLSLVAELQANFLINTEIKKLFAGTCQISIKKFDVEKRAGTDAFESKFNCTEKGAYEAIDSLNFGGKKAGKVEFREGKIGESAGDWEVGGGEETVVNFESEPAGAVVMVDGKIKCQKTPCSKMISEGNHEISMQLENYVEQTKGTVIKKGTKIRYSLEPDFGYLTVRGKYEVELKLDGEKIGKIPITKRVINPGAHQIEHTDGCYYQSGEKFQIKRGDNKTMILELNPKESAIKVTARDKDGNDVEATVIVDGKNVGTAPGTFKISLCSKEVAVKTKKGEFKQRLDLQEKKVSTVDAVLKPSFGNWSERAPNKMNWNDAKEYCANLNEGGYSDWRLPTISELRTLIKDCPATETGGECKVDGCLLSSCRYVACDGCSGSDDGKYSKLGDADRFWSSSKQKDTVHSAWFVDFYFGYVNHGYGDDGHNVRCVRGENIDGVKEQNGKDLISQEKKVEKADASLKTSAKNWSNKSSDSMNWDDAKAYCANLNEDGYSDWRLPTISELRTLIKNCPATETGGACKVTNECLSSSCYSNACGGCSNKSDGRYSKLGDTEWFWSSSEPSDTTGSAWYVGFSRGYVANYSKGNSYGVRCVR